MIQERKWPATEETGQHLSIFTSQSPHRQRSSTSLGGSAGRREVEPSRILPSSPLWALLNFLHIVVWQTVDTRLSITSWRNHRLTAGSLRTPSPGLVYNSKVFVRVEDGHVEDGRLAFGTISVCVETLCLVYPRQQRQLADHWQILRLGT